MGIRSDSNQLPPFATSRVEAGDYGRQCPLELIQAVFPLLALFHRSNQFRVRLPNHF